MNRRGHALISPHTHCNQPWRSKAGSPFNQYLGVIPAPPAQPGFDWISRITAVWLHRPKQNISWQKRGRLSVLVYITLLMCVCVCVCDKTHTWGSHCSLIWVQLLNQTKSSVLISVQIRACLHLCTRRCSVLISKNNPIWLIWNRNWLTGWPTSFCVCVILPHGLLVCVAPMYGGMWVWSHRGDQSLQSEGGKTLKNDPADGSRFTKTRSEFCA